MVIIACVVTASAATRTAREGRGAVAVVALQNLPPAKIAIDLDAAPMFGPAPLAVPPRAGHIPVTVDDATRHWAVRFTVPAAETHQRLEYFL